MNFNLVSSFKPTGDQPAAIEKLTAGILNNVQNQVLLGVTGSGKTFTIANVIKNVNRPTLIISHNKTLAAQLYQELRDFFPHNAVSYFVSYYDYYQPEAYIPQTDTYIAKETEINEEIDKLRLAATTNILTRKDTIVVASVSCIYNLGSPQEYSRFIFELKRGERVERKDLLQKLLDLMYTRTNFELARGKFLLRGETLDIFPSYEDFIIRIIFNNDTIERIQKLDPLNRDIILDKESILIYPAKHYLTDRNTYEYIFSQIRKELKERVAELKNMGKEEEAKRLIQRTEYDLSMIKRVGYVNGIENYSRYFDGRKPGEPPFTLLDYFEAATRNDKPWLLVIDESHMTIPQLRGMYNGDRARKEILVEYGFRLPSAFDNRPLKFEEFLQRIHQTIYMSATPDEWEIKRSGKENVVQQLIRPTGIVDPEVILKKTEGQIYDVINEIKEAIKRNERCLVTTLTKRTAEDLAAFLSEQGINVSYLHSEIDTLERSKILEKLRTGEFDVIVGINLLREGLDLPEVSRIFILDADKEGFLRSKTSLIQTIGRAARKTDSKVFLYADTITKSIKEAIEETERRRRYQLEYNKAHKIVPQSIQKTIKAGLIEEKDRLGEDIKPLLEKEYIFPDERERIIKQLQKEMKEAAKILDFETAAVLRDKIKYFQGLR